MSDAIPIFNLAETLRDRNQLSKEVANVAAVRALVSTSLVGGEIVTLADGTVYVFVATDAGVDDGDLIITPTDTAGNGRWINTAKTARDRNDVPTEVADVAAVRALVSLTLSGGEIVSLADGTVYTWVSAATGVDEGNLIITPTDTAGAGRWINISKTLRDRLEIPTAVANVAAIRALVSLNLIGGELLSLDDGTTYSWVAGDAGVDEGNLIITPTDTAGNGRWINISKRLRDRHEIPGDAADVAALRALVSLSLIGGELKSLVNGILYIWVAADAGVDDGDLIITPTDTAGNGRWRKSAILAV